MPRTPLLAAALVLSLSGAALGQADVRYTAPAPEEMPDWVAAQIADPGDPRVRAYAAQNKQRLEMEQELKKIRFDHFRARKTDIRQAGIIKLREFTDPVIYPSLLKLFERDGEDVRLAILDHLAELKNDRADTTIAWAAVFDKDKAHRAEAAKRLVRRMGEAGAVNHGVKSVVAEGLRSSRNDEIASAAGLVEGLRLLEAIPMLINAQIGGGTTVGTGQGGDTSLAWILVGTQQAFVADLTPVIGDSAVAFDPTIGVVTEGVVLRVIDANVITYRTEVHYALVRTTSEAWGKPTGHMGWDNRQWHRWYTEEFKPHLARQAREREEARAGAAAADPEARK
ncbi:MAG: hypothetical protein WD749_09750 [Phycisphaerales bacterium]